MELTQTAMSLLFNELNLGKYDFNDYYDLVEANIILKAHFEKRGDTSDGAAAASAIILTLLTEAPMDEVRLKGAIARMHHKLQRGILQ